jgi:hypothetical protein
VKKNAKCFIKVNNFYNSAHIDRINVAFEFWKPNLWSLNRERNRIYLDCNLPRINLKNLQHAIHQDIIAMINKPEITDRLSVAEDYAIKIKETY